MRLMRTFLHHALIPNVLCTRRRYGWCHKSRALNKVCHRQQTFEHTHHLCKRHIAIHIKDSIRRPIIIASKAQRIHRCVLTQPLGIPQNVASQGLPLKHHCLKLIEYQLRRRILVTVNFVANNLNLLVNLTLRIHTVKNNISKQVGSSRKVLFQNRGIIHRFLFCGVSIQVAPHPFKSVCNVASASTFRTFKRNMLYKVCHATVCHILVPCTSTHHIATIEHRRGLMLINHTQPAA